MTLGIKNDRVFLLIFRLLEYDEVVFYGVMLQPITIQIWCNISRMHDSTFVMDWLFSLHTAEWKGARMDHKRLLFSISVAKDAKGLVP